MKTTFKLLTIALVFTIATQSFGMSRLSRFASRPAFGMRSALVRVALKPATINPRLVTTTTAHLKAAAVASTQARTLSTSAPMRMQSSQQKEESHYNNAFKSSRARFAMGGLAALTGLGVTFYDQSAKAEGADESDERTRAIKAMQDKKEKAIQAVIDTHQVREEDAITIKFAHDSGEAARASSFIKSNCEAFFECLKFEIAIEDKDKQKADWNKCADFYAQICAAVLSEDEFIKKYPGYTTGALHELIGLDMRWFNKDLVYSRGKDAGKASSRGIVPFYIEASKSSIRQLRSYEENRINNLRENPLAEGESRLVEQYTISAFGRIQISESAMATRTTTSKYFVEKKK